MKENNYASSRMARDDRRDGGGRAARVAPEAGAVGRALSRQPVALQRDHHPIRRIDGGPPGAEHSHADGRSGRGTHDLSAAGVVVAVEASRGEDR